MKLKPETNIEEFIKVHYDLVGFLIRHDLPCVVCGEPFWGTLAELAHQKGWNEEQIAELVDEYNQLSTH
ncbi:MAG: DUF1858 domain-containing protein [Candidatus Zixiibacteriota bacterium]|nr:MAG: DUF1858 domain-containing protein [candidate division Zixibacteria bacterium]